MLWCTVQFNSLACAATLEVVRKQQLAVELCSRRLLVGAFPLLEHRLAHIQWCDAHCASKQQLLGESPAHVMVVTIMHNKMRIQGNSHNSAKVCAMLSLLGVFRNLKQRPGRFWCILCVF